MWLANRLAHLLVHPPTYRYYICIYLPTHLLLIISYNLFTTFLLTISYNLLTTFLLTISYNLLTTFLLTISYNLPPTYLFPTHLPIVFYNLFTYQPLYNLIT
jgi:hypothetical protein